MEILALGFKTMALFRQAFQVEYSSATIWKLLCSRLLVLIRLFSYCWHVLCICFDPALNATVSPSGSLSRTTLLSMIIGFSTYWKQWQSWIRLWLPGWFPQSPSLWRILSTNKVLEEMLHRGLIFISYYFLTMDSRGLFCWKKAMLRQQHRHSKMSDF